MIALGLRATGSRSGARIFSGLFDAASFWEPRRLPELFCASPGGIRRRPRIRSPARRRPGPAPPSWRWSRPVSAAVRSAALEIRFERQSCRSFSTLHVRGLRVGDAEADVLLHRSGDEVAATVTRRHGGVRIVIVH